MERYVNERMITVKRDATLLRKTWRGEACTKLGWYNLHGRDVNNLRECEKE